MVSRSRWGSLVGIANLTGPTVAPLNLASVWKKNIYPASMPQQLCTQRDHRDFASWTHFLQQTKQRWLSTTSGASCPVLSLRGKFCVRHFTVIHILGSQPGRMCMFRRAPCISHIIGRKECQNPMTLRCKFLAPPKIKDERLRKT